MDTVLVDVLADGTRLAIGGGGWYGGGGIALADLATGDLEVLRLDNLPPEVGRDLTVSGVWLAPDDRHLLASSWWPIRYPGPTLVFEVDGTRLRYRATLGRRPEEPWTNRRYSTDVAVAGGRAIVRRCDASPDEALAIEPLPAEISRAPAPEHITNRRVVVRDDCAFTGDQGIVRGGAGILRVPFEREHEAGWIEAGDTRVTSIGLTPDGDVVSGSYKGQLDLWDATWRRRCLRAETSHTEMFPELDLAWGTYSPNSITAICAVPGERGFVAASASGELTTWNGEHLAATQLAVRGSPRSLAAHPDGGTLAVALKQGGFGSSGSTVVLLEVSPLAIDPRWRTPRVLAMARAAAEQRAPSGTLGAAPLAILADALEEAGCGDPEVIAHLHAHDPRLRVCRVLDALLAG